VKNAEKKSANVYVIHARNRVANASVRANMPNDNYSKYFDLSPFAIFTIDIKGNIVNINKAAAELMGYSKKHLLSKNVSDFRTSIKNTLSAGAIRKLTKNSTTLGHFTITNKNKKVIDLLVRIVKISKNTNALFCQNITDQIQKEKNLLALSLRDKLTGVYNRTFFDEQLELLHQNIQRAKVSKNHVVLMIDVNGLKIINDSFGHKVGDDLLINMADILVASTRKNDVIARIGGDEFAILATNCRKDKTNKITSRIDRNVRNYNKSRKDERLLLSISVGAASYSEKADNPTPDKLLKRADDRMYNAKILSSSSVRSEILNTFLRILNSKDHIAAGHADRIRFLFNKLSSKLDLNKQEKLDCEALALLHDIGKITIPDKILNKKSKLTSTEMKTIKVHTSKGEAIIAQMSELRHLAKYVRNHHEWWDGSGYPDGLVGEEIPLQCRIVSILDAYDAMTSKRPYGKILSKEAAIKELKKMSGKQFDPNLVKTLIKIL